MNVSKLQARLFPSPRILSILPLLAICAALAAAARAEPLRSDNGADPSQGIVTMEMKELWRAGGDDDDVFFGNVLQVLPAPGGGVYVLDAQLLQVFAFSADGELVRTLGGRGEGPGEINNVNSLIALDDHTLGLGQVLPGKLVKIGDDGTPAGSIRITDPDSPDSGFVLLMDGRAHGSLLALAGMRWRMGDAGELYQNMFLRRYGLDGAPSTDYLTKSSEFDAANFVFDEMGFDFIWNRFGIDPRGRVCFAPHRNAYEIHVCNADGTVERVVTRAYATLERDDDAIQRARLTTEAIGSQYGRELRGVTVEKTEPDITALWCNPDGTTWVRTGRGDRDRAPGVLTTVDVFDVEGRFLRQQRLMCPGDPLTDGIHFLPGGRVVVVTGAMDAYRREVGSTTDESGDGEERALEVICYGEA